LTAHLLGDLAVAACMTVAGRLMTVDVHVRVGRARHRRRFVRARAALRLALVGQLVLGGVGVGGEAHVVRVRLADGRGAGAGDDGAVAARRVRQVALVQLAHLARARVHVCRRVLHGTRLLLVGHLEPLDRHPLLALRPSVTQQRRDTIRYEK